MRPIAVLCVVGSVAGAPSVADACSPPSCWPGFFTPADGATVPANAPALYWRPMMSYYGTTNDPTKVVLATTDAPGTPIAFTAAAVPGGDYVLTLAAPLTPGTTYTLTDHNLCMEGMTLGPSSTFHVDAAAPLPTQLGSLTAEPATGTLNLATTSGSCYAEADASYATIDLALAVDASPWRDMLLYSTQVDGAIWSVQGRLDARIAPGASWQGRGVDRVFHVCSSMDSGIENGVSAGMHDVTMKAALPGATIAVSAGPLTIDLPCMIGPDHDGQDLDGDPSSPHGGGCNASGTPGLLSVLLPLLVLRPRRRTK